MSGAIREDSLMASDWRSTARTKHVDEPLIFDSFLRPQVWGGDALGREFGKNLAGQSRVGESWEISGLPEHPSVVARGTFAGKTLPDLWATHDLTGQETPEPSFPMLIKWLDCRDFLSVQVHPDAELAQQLSGQICGKSEAWVVVAAEPSSRVYAGLRDGVTAEELQSRLQNGTLVDCLHSFVPKVGDCISLPAGTVHSAGGGVVFAEVQQPSDLTFRLYDWNRPGADGKPRALHIDKALKSIVWPQGPVSPSVPSPLPCSHGAVGESLLQTEAFQLERFTITDSWSQPHSGEMTIWMVLNGALVLDGAGYSPHQVFERGSTVLIPAGVQGARWATATAGMPCQLLCIRLPE